MTLDVGTLVLAAFGGEEILAIDIPTLLPLVFLLYMACTFLFNDDIKSYHAHNRHIRGWGERACKLTK